MKMIKQLTVALSVATALAVTTLPATAADKTKLRIQTHFSPETLSGQMAKQYIDDVHAMSNGEIEIEMF